MRRAASMPRWGSPRWSRRIRCSPSSTRRPDPAGRVAAMTGRRLRQLGLVVHPRREVRTALTTLQQWSDAHGVDVVQVPVSGQERSVAVPGDPAACDLIVALGGDGTTLAALHTAAAVAKPVLGVACGSLGALTAVAADEVGTALDRVAAGDWVPRHLPALIVESDGEEPQIGVNDLVVVREGAG